MVTALSQGIYIIESNVTDNQNWLTDPENIDLDNFTEGTDYVYCQIVTSFDKKPKNKWDITQFPGGSGFSVPMEERSIDVMFSVTLADEDRSTVEKIEDFWTKHTSFSDNDVYLIIKHGTNDYEGFSDENRVRREYCKGKTDIITTSWDDEEQLYELSGKFKGVW